MKPTARAAETSYPVLLEGNVYLSQGDVRRECSARTRAWSVCPWKGLARYYTVQAGGLVDKNAAWYYPHPSPLARKIRNHVAFWNGCRWMPGRYMLRKHPTPRSPLGLKRPANRECSRALRADRGRRL